MHPAHSPLMKSLSEHLLRHASISVWRKVFLNGESGIRFEQRVQTLLHARGLVLGWELAEVETLARRFNGRAELFTRGEALLSFDHPLHALRAALLLQRVGADQGVSVGLATGQCNIAHFQLDGKACRRALPPEASSAEDRARLAPPGTVVIGAETCELLAPFLADEMPDVLIATDCEGERVTQMRITLAPHSGAELSTYAGIGIA